MEGPYVDVQGGWAAPVLLQLAASPGEGGLGLDISGQSWVDNIIIIIIVVLVVVMTFYNLLLSINLININTAIIFNIGQSSSSHSLKPGGFLNSSRSPVGRTSGWSSHEQVWREELPSFLVVVSTK